MSLSAAPVVRRLSSCSQRSYHGDPLPKPTLRWLFAPLLERAERYWFGEPYRLMYFCSLFVFAWKVNLSLNLSPDSCFTFELIWERVSSRVQMRIYTTSRLLELFLGWCLEFGEGQTVIDVQLIFITVGCVAVYKCLCNSFRILNEFVSFSFSSRAETSEEIQLEAIMQVHFIRHTRCQLSDFKYFLISTQSGKVFHRWYVIFRWPNWYNYILMFALFSQRQLNCLEIVFVSPWLQKVRNTAKYKLLNDPTTRK